MKNLVAVLFALLSLNAFSQIPDYVPTDGLVAWLPLDNGVADKGPLSNETLDYGSEAAMNRFGQNDAARHFDAARIELPNNESIDQFKTISQWTRTSSSARQVSFKQNIFNGALLERVVITQNFEGANCHFGIKESCGAAWNYGNQNFDVADGEWHHFVGVIYPQETRLYIDGELISSVEITSDNETCSGGDLIIGSEWSGVSYGFEGEIDDVAVWNRPLSEEEILSLYLAPPPVLGCTNETACNFVAEAMINDESCVYSGCNDPSACNFNGAHLCAIDCVYPAIGEDCTAGEGLCGPGTYWDDASQTCKVTIPGDVDFNGCLSVEDLLGSLAIYNLCFDAEAIAFTCGVDVVNYDGYDYQTVQIGDQCWFAENCKHLPEVSPGDTGSEDVNLEPHAYVYGYNGTDVEEAKTFSDRYDTYGVLYNHFAAEAWQLCPSGWHKALAQDFRDLEVDLGLPEELVASGGGPNGTDIGIKLKAVGFGNGTNSSGFTFLGAGYREVSGNFHSLNSSGHMRAFAVDQSIPPNGSGIEMNAGWTGVGRMNTYAHKGFSVRCVKNAE